MAAAVRRKIRRAFRSGMVCDGRHVFSSAAYTITAARPLFRTERTKNAMFSEKSGKTECREEAKESPKRRKEEKKEEKKEAGGKAPKAGRPGKNDETQGA